MGQQRLLKTLSYVSDADVSAVAVFLCILVPTPEIRNQYIVWEGPDGVGKVAMS